MLLGWNDVSDDLLSRSYWPCLTRRSSESPKQYDQTKAMHTPATLTALDCADASTPAEMTVILAYENIAAAMWAAETITALLRRIPDGPEPHLSPWSFSTLEDPEYRAHAMAAAVEADLIVIATSSVLRLLPLSVESWLGKCLTGRHNATTAVAAFFGRADLPDRVDSPRLQTVQRLAKEAGCAFFAPGVNEATLRSA